MGFLSGRVVFSVRIIRLVLVFTAPMFGFLQSIPVISSSLCKNEIEGDNLHVLGIIPLFLHDVSLNSCLQQIGFVITSS